MARGVRHARLCEVSIRLQVVIYHPAAIGDVLLATPVALALKQYFVDCRITHVTHASLFPLLACCPYIDELAPVSGGLLERHKTVSSFKPDRVVDLSGSLKSRIVTFANAPDTVHYKKEAKAAPPMMHAVENFLQTLSDWGVPTPQPAFPTLPGYRLPPSPLPVAAETIALVPGVGNLRPHRAWSKAKWIALGQKIISELERPVILIGGEAERNLCDGIASQLGSGCTNASGRLSLPESAAAISACDMLISGDTGPAHLAVAVGTKVIGLYGPTFAERSGPYGPTNRVISVSHECECKQLKQCRFKLEDGRCMDQITYEAVYELLLTASGETVAKSMQ